VGPSGGLDVLEREISVGPAGIASPYRPIRSQSLSRNFIMHNSRDDDGQTMTSKTYKLCSKHAKVVWEWW